MMFKQIQETLGSANIQMASITDYEEDGVGIYYRMRYRFEDVIVLFKADKRNGEASLEIHKKDWDSAEIEAEKALKITEENERASVIKETEINGERYFAVKVIILKALDESVSDDEKELYKLN